MSAALDAILAARRGKSDLALPGGLAPATPEAGYALQLAVAKALGAVPPAGFKIGATTQQMQKILGLSGPAAGFVPAGSVNPNGTEFRFAAFRQPGVECEIGVRLGRDLPPGPCTPEAAGEAVAEVFPAIEIVEKRYGDMGRLHAPTLIADQVFHASGVIGAPCPGWREMNLGAVRGEFHVGGKVVGAGHGRDLLGHPMAALAWLAGSGAAEVFGGLRKDQVVWLGSVTPPIWLDGPCEVEARFEGLGTARLRFA
ncbi:fumarylacetoacetate hydrolase family protein [Siccirubricoccus sp. KC 17139]|uniref:Fumarylacetoacetate hydrolase family protein n=1 Tax=Siccirubricoccus soli TaxID=2899147 RepID=A0ABT1DFQ0_9PROT|nr:fumarylacetoacetate hydrolase family protein [Siccirubricoccus soli]MCO6420014.1 fumarylacetoacetate hydrolase family protein [Siccirubricoccus soli]MCP2686151.1 fumarylacetoacetate hydrolase family protein [Siccirubricoccus soli]